MTSDNDNDVKRGGAARTAAQWFVELDYETIAARLGVSKRTVEREMQHALEVCQKRLERSGR